jgi:hypothetical protein
MAKQTVDQKSLINLFPEIVDNNKMKILDIWNSFRVAVIPDLYNADAYTMYYPRQSDNLPLLAKTNYGDVKLWWLIPLVNDVEDPFDFIQNCIDDGTPIKILRSSYVSNIMFTLSRLKNAKDNTYDS